MTALRLMINPKGESDLEGTANAKVQLSMQAKVKYFFTIAVRQRVKG